MEFCHTLAIMGDYFTKALQGSQIHRFRYISIGIHYDEIPSHNASGRYLLEERKFKLKKKKEEAQEAARLTGD